MRRQSSAGSATRTGSCARSRRVGVLVSLALLAGLPQSTALPVEAGLALTMLAWFVLWALYQSIVNVGGSFYSFGWETLLLEAGFLAIFLGSAAVAPPLLVLLLYPLARVPGGVRGRPDQAPRRSLLARPHVHGLPPRDPADAEPAELVLPQAPAPAAPGRRRSATSWRSSCCRSGCSCRSRSRRSRRR